MKFREKDTHIGNRFLRYPLEERMCSILRREIAIQRVESGPRERP
jgi:hypothetical protein